MGTRLYPNTKDPAALERLARVPAGTYERLQKLRELVNPAGAANWHDMQDRYEELYELVHASPDISTLDHFLTFGWGKFASCGLAEGYAGRLDNLTACRPVLLGNGIRLTDEELALTGGLNWG